MNVYNARPDQDAVGWCHSCETHQRGAHARLVELPWMRGTLAWVCVYCDDEPWDLGVWVDREDEEERGCSSEVFCVTCANTLSSNYPPCTVHQ